MLDLLGWKHDLEDEEAAEAEAEAKRREDAGEDVDEPAAPPEPLYNETSSKPLCLTDPVDYPQWRTVRSFKPAPPRSPRSQAYARKHASVHVNAFGGGRRRNGRPDGTARTGQLEAPKAAAALNAFSPRSAVSSFLPEIVSKRNVGSWASTYAKKPVWEKQFALHTQRQKEVRVLLASRGRSCFCTCVRPCASLAVC